MIWNIIKLLYVLTAICRLTSFARRGVYEVEFDTWAEKREPFEINCFTIWAEIFLSALLIIMEKKLVETIMAGS
jgi:hypothetical protein